MCLLIALRGSLHAHCSLVCGLLHACKVVSATLGTSGFRHLACAWCIAIAFAPARGGSHPREQQGHLTCAWCIAIAFAPARGGSHPREQQGVHGV